MSARRKVLDLMLVDHPDGVAPAIAEQLLDEALAENSDAVTENYPGELVMFRGLVRVLRSAVLHDDFTEVKRLLVEHASDEGAAYEREKSSRPAADATPEKTRAAFKWPADWDQVLDAAIRVWPGEWQPKRVQNLYAARYGRGLYRCDARRFLSERARQGLLTLVDRPNGRFYTLKTRKGGSA